MKFTKKGIARASRLQSALLLEHVRTRDYSSSENLDWACRFIAWIATGHDPQVSPTHRERVELQAFAVEHQKEILALLGTCHQKIQTYVAAGGNPASDDLIELARQALACEEDEGHLYDTGKRVVSEIIGQYVPVYKMMPKKAN